MRTLAFCLFWSFAALLIASCATGRPAANAAPLTQKENPAPDREEVDYRCRIDADCTVKNVGNCCGYMPACVNIDSPTFPERVQQECQRLGIASTCGFREITACACVDGRCEAADHGGAAAQPVR